MLHPPQTPTPVPNGVYLPISKQHSILPVANLLAHSNINQICYCGQISLQNAAVFLTILHLWGYHLFRWQLYQNGTSNLFETCKVMICSICYLYIQNMIRFNYR